MAHLPLHPAIPRSMWPPAIQHLELLPERALHGPAQGAHDGAEVGLPGAASHLAGL